MSIPSIAKGLSSVSTEVAVGILNDLRIREVVLLMLQYNPAVDAALLAHDHIRALLGENSDELASTRRKLQDWVDLAKEAQVHLFPLYGSAHYWISSLVWKTIHERSSAADLQQYATAPIPPISINASAAAVREHWRAFELAKRNRTNQCAAQIRWAADLLERNPDILKRTLDPAQVRRPNLEHILNRMRRTASKMVRPSDRYKFTTAEYFRYPFSILIPFDEALAILCERMERHGITASDQLLDNLKTEPSGDKFLPIKALAQCVIDGMPYFYNSRASDLKPFGKGSHLEGPRKDFVSSDQINLDAAATLGVLQISDKRSMPNNGTKLPRTQGTPWSEETARNGEMDRPSFTPHKPGNNLARKPQPIKFGYHALDKREETWLESFVVLYRHLEELDRQTTGQS
ncbi:hypothetical protein N7468_007030 [Penicillium chermesinum]|uniref:Uncharacterized protein n=1 Tax=Penicillium chermesinum TaxID=63820 RepID=A0A9W9NTI5_9EURO|nr:uncharacterized protein N7468_007030 [Penicillium chermesinum]KAJ5225805.1 hypothetical protein N7468_007030 [Penicillium chermesinum]KAJ6160986.1 hypothetical protein N7470_004382 [Penicillium chermesinum]